LALTIEPYYGNVGIGTTEPVELLHIEHFGSDPGIRLENSHSSGSTWDIVSGCYEHGGGSGTTDQFGICNNKTGVLALTIDPNGNVGIAGNIEKTGTNGFVQDYPNDPSKEIVYVSLEGPEAGTYIRGTAQLVSGEAIITLPEHFSLVATEEGLTVQLTPVGEWLQLYVVEKGTQRIIVREANGKNGQFDYLVQGVRKGYEDYQVIRDK
jgi:hypothetical protein